MNAQRCFTMIILAVLVVVFCAVIVPKYSYAAAVDENFVTQIGTQFKNKAAELGTKLHKYALNIFALFLLLDVAMLGIRAALNRDQIPDIFRQFVMLLLFAGFILAVINNYQDWTQKIINGLLTISSEVGGASIDDSPFAIGYDIVSRLMEKVSAWSPIDSLTYIVVACAIMICFALITAQTLFITCEAFIAMNAAILLLGFGGSSITKDYAINTMRYAVSVAFKLFVMQIILGIGLSFINNFKDVSTDYQELLVLIGASIVLLALVRSLPDVVAGIINGSHVGSSNAMTGAAMTAGAAALGAGMMAYSGGKGGINAGRLASAREGGLTPKNVFGVMNDARREAKQKRHENAVNNVPSIRSMMQSDITEAKQWAKAKKELKDK